MSSGRFAVVLLALLQLATTAVRPACGQMAPWLRQQPVIVGDFFGFGPNQVTLTERSGFEFDTFGFLVSGTAGAADSVLVFEANGGTADDFFTTGTGADLTGDGFADRFDIVEPLPPNEVPTSPGSDFQFEGGQVTYTEGSGASAPVNGAYQSGDTWRASYSYSRPTVLEIGAAAAGGVATRRIKIGENNSAIPRDRLLFDYRLFSDAIAGIGNVNRYVFGFEKACGCGDSSFELRVPFASTLDSIQTLGGSAGRDIELGNLLLSWKKVLWHSAQSVVSAGVGLSLPTADDTVVRLPTGPTAVRINNQAVHLLPFVGYLKSNGIEALQLIVQLDVDTHGNPVRGDLAALDLQPLGTLNDATWLFVDLAYSRWIYRCTAPGAHGVVGMAPFIELHYSSTLGEVDRVVGSGIDVGNRESEFDIFNLTTGTHLQMGDRTYVTPAFVIPLQSDADKAFDFEFALLVNRFF